MRHAASPSGPVLGKQHIADGGGRLVRLDGRPVVNFAGCNYLAIGGHAALRAAAQGVLDSGAPWSRYLVTAYGGIDAPFEAVEIAGARFFGTEEAVYLASGYLIGFAAMAALDPLVDVVLLDEQAHWCLSDAAKLSGKPVVTFANCDPASLRAALAELETGLRPLVATDGAFATSGRVPPLDLYAALIADRAGQLLIDESHIAGVGGMTGRGAAQHYGLSENVMVGSTLSKGLCAHGAMLTGSADAMTRARMAHGVRGATPGSPISAAVAAAALDLVRAEPERCRTLSNKADELRARLRAIGLDIADTPAAIVSFTIGDFDRMRALQTSLLNDDGIYVLHSNYIAAGVDGTIRLSVFGDHTVEDFDRLEVALRRLIDA